MCDQVVGCPGRRVRNTPDSVLILLETWFFDLFILALASFLNVLSYFFQGVVELISDRVIHIQPTSSFGYCFPTFARLRCRWLEKWSSNVLISCSANLEHIFNIFWWKVVATMIHYRTGGIHMIRNVFKWAILNFARIHPIS